LDWIYEYGSESRHKAAGRITLSTVHAAKGREFKHVLILDGSDWRNGELSEERRLYYVAMTRARETLTLCESSARPNPFSRELDGDEFVVRTPLKQLPAPRDALDQRYIQLGLADVDLGFAGRKPAADPVHRAIGELKVGDSLNLARLDGRWVLKDRRGLIVGRLAQKFEMPSGDIEDVRISAIVHRSKRQCRGTEWESRCQVDNWEVVLCQISIRPERTQRLAV
jgi:ATP-dependent DNA helicase RecQ